LIGLVVVLVLFAGELIVTTGATPRLTVTVAVVELPKALAQATLIVFGPIAKAAELVDVLVEAAPFTVQVVPAGIVVPPLTV
jgi:hypothetical protein